MKNKFIYGVLSVGLLTNLSAATIDWDPAQNITSDADVCTEGTLCYAYKAKLGDTTLNGVTFKGWGVENLQTALQTYNWTIGIPYCSPMSGVRTGASDPFMVFYNLRECRVDSTFLVDRGVISSAYQDVLGGAAFNRAAATTTVTLCDLQPGEDYLVQIWINDNRNGQDKLSTVLDDVCAVRHYLTDNAYGQYAVGRFRADAVEQVISLYSANSPQLNAIQVRRISKGIDWRPAQTVGTGTDVNTEGRELYGYHFYTRVARISVNGVSFARGGDAASNPDFAQDVTLASDGASGHTLSFSQSSTVLDTKATYLEGMEESYKSLIGGAVFVRDNNSTPSWLDVTLKGLTPGHRYLVQLWHQDSRYDADPCALTQRVDGSADLLSYDVENGKRGQSMVGTFIATADRRTVRIRGYNKDFIQKNNPFLNALQVRDITDVDGGKLVSSETAYVTDAGCVRTDGELAYAYTRVSAGVTVNDVPFAGQTSVTDWGDGNVTLEGFTEGRENNTFCPGDATPLGQLLGAGLFARSTQVGGRNPAPIWVTFGNLSPSRYYLIQMWINDSRPGMDSQRVLVEGQTEYSYYQNPDSNVKYGTVATLVIRPDSSSYKTVLWYTAKNSDGMSPLLNAVQVRELPASYSTDELAWNGGASGTWSASAEGWTSASGSVPENPWSVDGGTTFDALIPDGTELTVSGAVKAGDVLAQGALTVKGERMPTLTGEFVGGDVTLEVPWPTFALERTREGRLTLAGDCTALGSVNVIRGTLAFAASATLPEKIYCAVSAPGKIELMAGAVLPFAELTGTGFIGGEGVALIGCPLARTVGGTWTDAAVLRKTGAADLTVVGTSAESPLLDVTEGTARLSVASTAPWRISVAANAVVDLCGLTHPIAGLSGAGTVENGVISGVVTNEGAVTVASTASFASGWKLVRTGDEAMTVDAEAVDMALCAGVSVPDAASFFVNGTPVLKTTGTFVGRLPRVTADTKGWGLEIVALENGGQVLQIVPKGTLLILR